MPSSGCLPTPLAWSRGATCSGRCPSGPWGPEPVLAPWPPPDVTQGCRSMVRAQTFPSGAAVPSASPVGLPGGEAGRAPAEQTCALCQGPLRSLCPFIVRLSGLNRGPGGAGPRAAAVKRTPEHPAPLRWHLCVLGRGQGRLVPGEGFGPQKAHQLMGWEREGHLCGWRNAADKPWDPPMSPCLCARAHWLSTLASCACQALPGAHVRGSGCSVLSSPPAPAGFPVTRAWKCFMPLGWFAT